MASRLGPEISPSRPTLIIGADTVVESEGIILEKPADPEEAKRVLASLSGRTHHVHTGVALLIPHADVERRFSVTTEVTFATLSPSVIDTYVATGDSMDKAGSYGIQGMAAAFVSSIHGCYFNVVGLPVHRVCTELAHLVEEGIL